VIDVLDFVILRTLLRRTLMVLCGAFCLAAATSCTTRTGDGGDVTASQSLSRLADAAYVVAKREPGLPGVRAMSEQSSNSISGLSEADQALVTSALYFDVRNRLASRKLPVGEAGIRTALAKPLNYPRYTSEYLSTTLAATRERMNRDPDFQNAMYVMPNDPFLHGHCVNWLTGEEEPCALWKFNRVIFVRNLLWDEP
jgi:hypothetical protein